MQVNITGTGLWRGFCWTMAALFWLVLFLIVASLLTARGDSGAAYIIMGFMTMAGRTLPFLLVPIFIVIGGVRRDHDTPLWKALLKWGTIATAIYVFGLIAALLTAIA